MRNLFYNHIFYDMLNFKRIFIEAVIIVSVASVVAFTYNAFSANGIDPFKKVDDVPTVPSEKADDSHANGIVFIDIGKAKEFFNEGKPIIDARTAEAYREGHIPGAYLLDYYEMGRYMNKVLMHLSMDEDIMLYCSGYTCDDSELLARELYTMGFTKLYVYKGGFDEWEESGMPVEGGDGKAGGE